MTERASHPPDDGWSRQVVERVVAGVLIVQNGRIAYANPYAARLLGRDVGELVGMALPSLLAEEERGRHDESTAALMTGRSEQEYNEYRVLLPDGRTRQLAASSTLTEWAGRPATVGVLHDISRQRAATAALRGSEERYRSMVESLHEGVLIFDASGRLKGANPAAERLLRGSYERLRRSRLADWDCVDADGEPMPSRDIPIAAVLASGKPQRHAMLGLRLDDGVTAITWFDVNSEPLRDAASGAITGAVLSFTDVTAARRVQEALRVSESTNRTLMDALADGVFVAQDFCFKYANRLLLQQLGYTREEFFGLPFERVIAPASLDTWLERYRGRVGTGPEPVHTYEASFLRKDGSVVEFELVANRSTYMNAPGVLGVLRDITERKRAEAELERHRNRLEELVAERTRALEEAVAARIATENFAQTMTDHQPTLLAYIDRDSRIQFANRSYLTFFGKTREEVVGRDAREMAADYMLQPPQEFVQRVMAGEALGTPSDMRGHDGRVSNFWIYRLPDVVDGAIRGYFFIATDITEMRRSERRLQELNAKLIQAESFTRGIADNLPSRVAYWDSEERCRFANRVYCEWFGRTLDQVLGRTIAEIFGAAGTRQRHEHVRAALAGEPQLFETTEVSADGREAVWSVHYIPDVLRGEVRGFFVLASDITASKRAQADLQSLNEELVTARDLAEDAAQAKSAFLANMSHEIRTPMNVVIGLTHLMRRDAHDEVTSDRLGKVGDAAQHLLDIINDILDLSKIDAGKLALTPVDFSVDALLARSGSMVADGARRKGLQLTVDRGDLPQALRGDPLRLSQVLVNLLSNAVKFTSQGSIVLRCSVQSREGDGLVVRFTVHDTGVGITREAVDRLFRPFEQADGSTTRRFGGTGLGLSIARELAQLMGGEVGVESEPGRGSMFWFTARLQAAQADVAARPVVASPAVAGDAVEVQLKERHSGARMLLADDNRINQELASELLRLVGLEVDVADNGRIAFDMMMRSRYDLVLMDMQMPEMDGLESTRLIRARPEFDATPIVAMTASAFGADRDACLAAGMNDHIGKPVNPATLYETLLRWLDATRRDAAPAKASSTQADAKPRTETKWGAKPATKAATTDALEGVDGLDAVRGLGLFAGQRALYLQALGYFVDLYGNGLAAVDKCLAGSADASPEAVGREIHSMGGAAAALGATRLEASARRIDRLVRDDLGREVAADDGELRGELAALRDGLRTMVQQLRAALGLGAA